MESDGFIRTEGTEFDGVVAAVEASEPNSRDDVDDEEDGGLCENVTGRDTVESAASSHDDCMLSDACWSAFRGGPGTKLSLSGLLCCDDLELLKIEKRDLKLPLFFIVSVDAGCLASSLPAYAGEDWGIFVAVDAIEECPTGNL
jgi:hypothetical protein